jgi:hypothetical protein
MTLWEFSCYSKGYNPREIRPVCVHRAPHSEVIQRYDEIVDAYYEQEINYEDMTLERWPPTIFLQLGGHKRDILDRYNRFISAVESGVLHPLTPEGSLPSMTFLYSELKQYAITNGWEMLECIYANNLIPDNRQVLYTSSKLQMLIMVFTQLLSGVTDDDEFPPGKEIKSYIRENWDHVSQGRIPYSDSIGNQIVSVLNSDRVSRGGAPRTSNRGG